MARDHEWVQRLQERLGGWNPDLSCPAHKECRCGVYDGQERLIELHLCNMGLQVVPSEVWQLRSLQILALWENRLTSLPAEIGQLSALQVLELGNNRLSLPAEIGQLSALQVLGLAYNFLPSLPAEIGQLSALQVLELGHNFLPSLPAEIGQLSALQVLNLERNRLSSLPAEIGQLSALQVLSLRKNKFASLPTTLGHLTNLETLELSDNFLQAPPWEIIVQGTSAILAYLRTLHQAKVEHFEAKVLLVGEGEMGKTSLLRALRQQPFLPDLSATHGIEVDTLRLHHPSRSGAQITLASWDFGGQQIFQATHQFFMTRRSVYLLIWNARRGAEAGRLAFWLDTIAAHAPDAKVILVATFIDTDLTTTPMVELAAYQQRHPQVVALCPVSNKTGEGLEMLKVTLAAVAAQTPFVGATWPRTWVEAEQALLARPEHHLDAATFTALCAQYTIQEETERDTFGSYLHDLGKVLYFQDDPVLRTLIVLKPNWISKAISRVLEDLQVRQAGGILAHQDLARIWATDDEGQPYPRALYPIFVRMMERFELCYQLEPARPGFPATASLIPQLLPEQPPAGLPPVPTDPAAGDVLLTLRYTLSFVPAGLMSRLLVRCVRSSQRQHWRTGARLAHGGQQAQLELNTERRELTLTVWGAFPYAFFQLLKHTIDDLLASFEGLRVDRWLPCPCLEGRLHPHDHRYDTLERRLAQGQTTIECQEGTPLALATLLFGLHPSTVPQVSASVQQTQQRVLQQVGSDQLVSLAQLSEDLRRQFAILQQGQELELHTMLRLAQQDLKLEREKLSKTCPGLFLLERSSHSRFHPQEWVSRSYRLRLLCQYPGGLHLVPGEDGYELRESKAWWQVMRPWLRGMVRLLEIGVPLGKAVNEGLKLLDVERIAPALDVFQEILGDLPELEGSDQLGEAHLKPQGQVVQELEGAALDALHAVLSRFPRPWQGLYPVLLEDRSLVWVCDQHRRLLETPLVAA